MMMEFKGRLRCKTKDPGLQVWKLLMSEIILGASGGFSKRV